MQCATLVTAGWLRAGFWRLYLKAAAGCAPLQRASACFPSIAQYQYGCQSCRGQILHLDGRVYWHHHCGDRLADLGAPLDSEEPPASRLLGDRRLRVSCRS